jgi:CheY-like chemotaxis protein
MPQTAPLKLLVVDDHAGFRQTVRQIFDAMKTEITEASSGEEAVELYAAVKPDWVVMDLRMPGLGGLRATECIRNLNPQARVIVISQFDEPEFREQARRAGAVEFVNKEEVSRLAEIIGAPGTRT